MNFRACSVLSLIIAMSCPAFAAAHSSSQPAQTVAHTPGQGPIPPAILSAKSIFLSNGGSDSGLFPEPFTGDQSRPYAQFYADLKASDQFKLVDDPADADLVLELSLIAPPGPTRGSKQYGAADPLPQFRLVIYDRKSHYALWTLNESIELAFQQKTHDRNFDDALKFLFEDFLKVAGKHMPQTR